MVPQVAVALRVHALLRPWQRLLRLLPPLSPWPWQPILRTPFDGIVVAMPWLPRRRGALSRRPACSTTLLCLRLAKKSEIDHVNKVNELIQKSVKDHSKLPQSNTRIRCR